jgi:hypothetical protein
MLNFASTSIQRKQMLVMMLTSCVALLLAGAGFMASEVITFRKGLRENLATLAEVLGNNATGALEFNDPKVAEELLASLRAEPNILAACIYNKAGSVFSTYQGPEGPAAFTPPRWESSGYRFTREHLHLFHDIHSKGEKIGTSTCKVI